MFVIAQGAGIEVRLVGRFDAPQARSVGDTLSLFRPVRHVVIDFARVRDVDDAAVAMLAESLGSFTESRFTFRGLSRHLQRLLRYVGVNADGAPDGERRPPAARPNRMLQVVRDADYVAEAVAGD